ncbi:D-amino-acid transaminase [Marinococcus halophilus]|uniref:D-alanine aminotransferase n=1 Tax=Marinococcus halophilus TaxID=1371 RepID=A0A510Y7L0_MARHA|nr:D-amino-acid transaminase [Marinococcus halophilus]OZT80977.1 D-amino-acid transaminase [Marinococcus halophilus]GEK59360.1 D-alanine aminotransferase [Marinococcus halophilus]
MSYVMYNESIIPKEEAAISFDDRGYYFGDGIYEVIRVYNGKLFLQEGHLERFQDSASKLDLTVPCSPDTMKSLLRRLIEKNGLTTGYVYFQLTRGIQARDHLYQRGTAPVLTGFTKASEVPFAKQADGINVYATEDIRWLRCDIKTINLLGNVLAKRAAEDHDCAEALQHRGEVITEGSSTNAFIVKDETVITHPQSNYILEGITKRYVLQLAKQLNIPVEQRPFTIDEAIQADEMFMTSTSIEIVPVRSIKGSFQAEYGNDPVTKELLGEFRREVELFESGDTQPLVTYN